GTYHLRDAAFDGRIEKGLLKLTRGDFDGVAGPLSATGTIDLVGGPLSLDVEGTLSAEQITALGIEGLSQDGRADLTITSNLKTDDGRFRLGGRVRYAPFTYTPDVRVETLTAELSGWTKGGDFAFRVGLEGEGGLAYGLGMATLAGQDIDVRKTPSGLVASGPVTLGGVELPSGAGRFERAQVGFEANLPTTGPRVVDATIGLGAFDLQTFLGSDGTARVHMVDDVVDFDVGLDDGDRQFLRTAGTFDLGASHLRTSRFELAPTPRLSWVGNGPLELTLVEGGVSGSRISLRGSHGDLDVSGDLATVGKVDGRVKVVGLQLDALAELFPDAFDGLSGVLRLDSTITGPAESPTLDGLVDLEGFWMEGVARWLDVDGTFRGEGGDVRLDLALGAAGTPLGALHGTLPVDLDLAAPGLAPARAVDLGIDVAPGLLERLEQVTTSELGVPEGELSAHIDVNGALRDPAFRIRGVVESAVPGWIEPGRVEVDVSRQASTLSGWTAVREGIADRAQVTLTGDTRMSEVFASAFGETEVAPDTSDLELWVDDMVVHAELDHLPTHSLLAVADLEVPATGDLVGALVASGSPYTPRIDGEMRWESGSVGDVAVDVGHLLLRPVDGGLDVQLDLQFQDGSLLVEGKAPLAIDLREDASTWTAGDLDLHIEAVDMPLALASVVDGVGNPAGKLAASGTVKGTIADPLVELDASVDGGRFVYEPLGLQVSDLVMEAEGRGRRVKLTRLVARTEPLNRIGVFDENRASLVRMTGAANLDQGALDELSARVTLDDAWLMGTYDTAMRVAGDVRVSGAWPALNVDGKVELVNGRYVYRADDAVAAAPLQPVPELVIHRAGESRTFTVPTTPPVYESFDIDLAIDLKRNLEVVAVTPFFDDLGKLTATITQANVNARVGGDVRVGLNPDASWRVGGEVDVVDGTVQVLRTKFRLDDGTITLFPDDLGESPLDLSAESHVQDTTIDLRISGTVDEPSLAATSDGFDDTQVLVMLITGKSVASLTSTQGQAASQDAALAAAALLTSSVFSGAAAGALSFEADGSVRVGAPWSASIFSELVLRPFADQDENVVSFALEWALVRGLLLQAGAGDRYQWLDASWETRF
ncbi:MAG: translocation/assembly module TamB domain-containing protein, partial [Alphaproteobacteria bacterium]|nr:translocation/assembly module TamB domain-containing protein [Alphaproteobacteria bacterium]